MKRQRDSRQETPSTSLSRGSKRSKSVQACEKCRKHKTRCEILDATAEIIRCHRCKVLEVPCSYEEMERSVFELPHTAEKEHETTRDTTNVNETWRTNRLETLPGFSHTPLGLDKPGGSNPSLPADMFPNKPQSLWDFIQVPDVKLDWAAPLQAMQELLKQSLTSEALHSSPAPPVANESLDNILTPNEILHLTSIFERDYMPWLNFTPIREVHSPLLDLVYCTIASRHLDEDTRSIVAPRLQALTADNIAKMIFQSRRSETLESIQCLLILSLWAPVCGADEAFRDGHLLVASAVSMAHNLRLNDACEKVATLRGKEAKGEEVAPHEMSDAMNRTRLWLALTNAESLLCIGSARKPLSKRSATYLSIFPLASPYVTDIPSGRDLRLRLLAELFDIAEAGLVIRLQSSSESDVNIWYEGFTHVLANLSRCARILLPLGVISDFDVFYFKMLNILVSACRMLTLYHATVSAREYFILSGTDHPFWFRKLRPHGLDVLITWGKGNMGVSESILVVLLEVDVRLLGTSPDYVFNMIAFAASYVLGCKHLVLQSLGVDLPGPGNQLLAKCVDKLYQCSYSPDSAARKCAALIAEMLAQWQKKLVSFSESRGARASASAQSRARFKEGRDHPVQAVTPISDTSHHSPHSPHSLSPSSLSQAHPNPEESLQLPQLPQQHFSTAPLMNDADANWLDPELFKDDAFWNNLFADFALPSHSQFQM